VGTELKGPFEATKEATAQVDELAMNRFVSSVRTDVGTMSGSDFDALCLVGRVEHPHLEHAAGDTAQRAQLSSF